MSYWTTAAMLSVVMLGIGLALTHEEEVREGRWWKITVSMPPVLVIASAIHNMNPVNAYFSAFSFGILGFIWKSPIAHYGSVAFMRMLHGDLNRPTGIRAEFGAARAFHKHGELDDALIHTKRELDKEPYSYEGLLLLAQIHVDLDEPEKAMEALERLLAHTPLTAEQRAAVSAIRRELQEAVTVLA